MSLCRTARTLFLCFQFPACSYSSQLSPGASGGAKVSDARKSQNGSAEHSPGEHHGQDPKQAVSDPGGVAGPRRLSARFLGLPIVQFLQKLVKLVTPSGDHGSELGSNHPIGTIRAHVGLLTKRQVIDLEREFDLCIYGDRPGVLQHDQASQRTEILDFAGVVIDFAQYLKGRGPDAFETRVLPLFVFHGLFFQDVLPKSRPSGRTNPMDCR